MNRNCIFVIFYLPQARINLTNSNNLDPRKSPVENLRIVSVERYPSDCPSASLTIARMYFFADSGSSGQTSIIRANSGNLRTKSAKFSAKFFFAGFITACFTRICLIRVTDCKSVIRGFVSHRRLLCYPYPPICVYLSVVRKYPANGLKANNKMTFGLERQGSWP